MSGNVSKINAHAWLLPPASPLVSKLILHMWLLPQTNGVSKISAHVWLLPDAPDFLPYEAEVAFGGGGGLGLAAPTLIYLGALAFGGRGGLGLAGEVDPPFHCAPPSVTAWSEQAAAATAYVCGAVASTPWRGAGEAGVNDILVDVAGAPLVCVNGDRIWLT